MKIAAIALLLILAVIASGCTAPAPAAAPSGTPAGGSSPVLMDLKGTWVGPMTAYEPGAGFTNYGNTTMSMIVSEQQGRIFAGTFVFGSGTNTESIPFSGVIGRDGTSLTIPQETGGYSFGEIISPGEIELVYVSDGAKYSASIDTLKKV